MHITYNFINHYIFFSNISKHMKNYKNFDIKNALSVSQFYDLVLMRLAFVCCSIVWNGRARRTMDF